MGSEAFVDASVYTESHDVDPDLTVDYLPESRRWRITGTIGAEQETTRTVPARDPVRLSLDALARAMEGEGITVDGGTRVIWDRGVAVTDRCLSGELTGCVDLVPIAERWSAPLSEIVAAILAPSQNWMTEQLVRTLGSEMGSAGSWPEGFRAAREYLRVEAGVDTLDLRMEDGSGLSAKNLVSPRAMVAMLGHVREQPWFYSYLAGMAHPGGLDSTLEGRLGGLEGRVFGKTGTISNVNSLSGYLIRDDGRELLFSILTNASNLSAAAVRGRIDAIVREMAKPTE
jgi:D-alanyl-D-alanine carboxypeptidase/D-alanyl-D-alanine-endopeptidase (penicillin-binding protein 4)